MIFSKVTQCVFQRITIVQGEGVLDMDSRIEHDSMGEVLVPKNNYWGAQTQRSVQNFRIGTEKMPSEIIHAFGILKKGAALANLRLGNLDAKRAKAICAVCDEIIAGKLDEHFPLVVWQTGSGTQTNMNVNEVIANRANEMLGEKYLHPNDDVNRSQSSNDTFPTAMHIAALMAVEEGVLPALDALAQTFDGLIAAYGTIIKTGRTHFQDAVPLTLGQEISGWHHMLTSTRDMLVHSCAGLRELALGGTAVGTGLNAVQGFGQAAAEEISRLTGKSFVTAVNKFHALTSKDALVFAHGALKALAVNLMKIANDIRFLSSGPRCGIGELLIPENEPGSSIMPGKVNPTQCEALVMLSVQVMANDTAVAIAASQGHLELNVLMPVCIYNFLQSARLLGEGMISFNQNCAVGIRPNKPRIAEYLKRSLMTVTALNPIIGYENAARIAQTAQSENLTLKQAALQLGLLDEAAFDAAVAPEKMTKPTVVSHATATKEQGGNCREL